MADLGSIATKALLVKSSFKFGNPIYLRKIDLGGQTAIYLGGKETVEGNAQPCLRMDVMFSMPFRWIIQAGTRTVKVDVKQPINLAPRPRLRILANPAIGINADVDTDAASGAGWLTIGPVTINPSSDGVLKVLLMNLYDGPIGAGPCYWDNLVVT